MRKIILSAILILTLFAGACGYEQPEPKINSILPVLNSYFVSTNGSDSNDGSQSKPFKTIQKCNSIANSGTSCEVSAGTYNERITVSRSGLTFKANGLVTMLGFTVTGNDNVVDGFYVLNSTNGEGGVVLKGTRNLAKNLKIEGATLNGMTLQGTSNIADGNFILNSLARNSDDADGFRVFGSNHIIRNNRIELRYGENEKQVDAHIDCFQTWDDSGKGVADNILIYGNLCKNPDYYTSALKGQGVMFDQEDNGCKITFSHNVFVTYRGMYILNTCDLVIINNTFDNLLKNGSGIILQNVKRAIIKNNIFYNNSSDAVSNCCSFLAPAQAGWNWNYRSDGGQLRGVKYSTDTWAVNPLFVSPSTNDYRLASNSPACRGGEGGTYVGAFPCGVISITATSTSIPVSPTPTATVVPSRTPTNTAVATVTRTSTVVPASVTPTLVSPTLVSPTKTFTTVPSTTSTSVPSVIPSVTVTFTVTPTALTNITPTIVASATATPSPAPVCKWLGWFRIVEWLRCLRS